MLGYFYTANMKHLDININTYIIEHPIFILALNYFFTIAAYFNERHIIFCHVRA